MHQQFSRSSDLNIVFIMDGYDEIGDSNVRKADLLLKTLRSHEKVRLIISSRPQLRKRLQNNFELVPYDIQPYRKTDQVDAIAGEWKQKISDGDEDKLKMFASRCAESITFLQENNTHIIGIPLICHLLAVVFEIQAEHIHMQTKNPCT